MLANPQGDSRVQANHYEELFALGAPRSGTSSRVVTPPRDPKDNKCANCNKPGHTKEDCLHPAISIEDRKCHICDKTGHIARKCPDKDKGARPGSKPVLFVQVSPGTAIVPYGNLKFFG